MARIKIFSILFGAALFFSACEKNDDSEVYRELLTEALWMQEYGEPGATSEACYFDFTDDGVVYVFVVLPGGSYMTEHRYIYDPAAKSMAIEGEGYGLYRVEEISTERIILEEDRAFGNGMVLCRCKDRVEMPEID